MRAFSTDYLVVGAGASGLAFLDSLMSSSDTEAVLVDRRERPGGHWLNAYPFVRLHQPSAYYGVTSRRLGDDSVDDSGPNAGFYERATGTAICEYFADVLADLVSSGRVRFLGASDYRGKTGDTHHVVSTLSGEETTIKVRHKVVDATYVESSVPSVQAPPYVVDDGVTLISPNQLVDLAESAGDFTVVGAGKTSADTCNWLLDSGVDPARIRWIRPRDPWQFDRQYTQPLTLVGSYMQLQARWVEAACAAESGEDFARRLASSGVFVRLDPRRQPEMFRGATISRTEIDSLRTIERVVAGARVLRVQPGCIVTDRGPIPTGAREVHVDCTAAGLRPAALRPVFEAGRITLQYVTVGIVPWSAATVGVVEATRNDDAEKNRLCPPLTFSGNVRDLLSMVHSGLRGLLARGAEPDLATWTEGCRLNPARGAADHLDDPQVRDAFASLVANIGPAMRNLDRRTRSAAVD